MFEDFIWCFLNKTVFFSSFQIWSHVWSSACVLVVTISFPGQKLSPWPTNSYYSSQTTFFFRRVWPKIWISSLDIRKEKLFLLTEQNVAEVYRSEFFSIWNSISLYLTKNKVLGWTININMDFWKLFIRLQIYFRGIPHNIFSWLFFFLQDFGR